MLFQHSETTKLEEKEKELEDAKADAVGSKEELEKIKELEKVNLINSLTDKEAMEFAKKLTLEDLRDFIKLNSTQSGKKSDKSTIVGSHTRENGAKIGDKADWEKRYDEL